MKKALILYWHGLGDVIILTPVLRTLYIKGYSIDLMCRQAVQSSHLLDECPYINKQIIVENPWRSSLGFVKQSAINIALFDSLKNGYDWSGKCIHKKNTHTDCKIEMNFLECNLPVSDKKLEIFIAKLAKEQALTYIQQHYPKGYIFRHTDIEFHTKHNWNCVEWVRRNLPDLPIVNTGQYGNHFRIHDDINFTFVLAREATYRVLSSSVIVHACDAMNVMIDVINYGTPDRKVWIRNGRKVKRIREAGKWI